MIFFISFLTYMVSMVINAITLANLEGHDKTPFNFTESIIVILIPIINSALSIIILFKLIKKLPSALKHLHSYLSPAFKTVLHSIKNFAKMN